MFLLSKYKNVMILLLNHRQSDAFLIGLNKIPKLYSFRDVAFFKPRKLYINIITIIAVSGHKR